MMEENMSQARLNPSSVKSDGRYTSPKTWGVYEVRRLLKGKRFRFGNHPVRQRELIQEYGVIDLVGWLYRTRDDAKEATDCLNREWRLSHNEQ
jgi:hypothetical protein